MTDSSFNESERRNSFRLDMEKEFIDSMWKDENGQEKNKKIDHRNIMERKSDIYDLNERLIPKEPPISIWFEFVMG